MRTLCSTFVVVAVLSACGGNGGGSVSAELPEVSPAPAFEPTGDPIEDAGNYYLSIVHPTNCHPDRIRAMPDAAYETWDAFQQLVRPELETMRDLYVEFAENLTNYDWPSEVAFDARLLADEALRNAAYWDRVANISSLDDDLPLSPNNDRTTAARIRMALGLPSNIGGEDSC